MWPLKEVPVSSIEIQVNKLQNKMELLSFQMTVGHVEIIIV